MDFSAFSRDIYFRRPMVWVGAIFCLGVLLGVEFPAGRSALGVCAILLCASAFILFLLRSPRPSRIALGVAIGITGSFLSARAIMPDFSPDHVLNLVGKKKVIIKGQVHTLPRNYPDRSHLFVDVQAVKTDNAFSPARGTVRITVGRRCPRPRYGDELIIEAKFKKPRNFSNPGSFNYERYMTSQGIFVTGYVNNGKQIKVIPHRIRSLRCWIQNLRQDVANRIDRLGEGRPEGDILRALLVGDRWVVSRDIGDLFSRAGVAHLLAVSGLHLGIIASLSYFFILWFLKRSEKLMLVIEVKRVAALVTIISVVAYAELAGGRIPTIRAAVMVGVYLLAVAIGRWSDLPSAIALAAVAILAIWPASITDAGFILSFSAVIIIAALIPVLQYRFPIEYELELRPRLARWKWNMRFAFFVGFAILAATLPITSMMFHKWQYLSPLTNLLFIPLVGYLILPIGIVAVILLPVLPSVSDMLLKADLKLTGWTIEAVEWFAQAPGTDLPAPAPHLFQAVMIFVMVVCFIGYLGPPDSTRRIYKWVSIAAVIALLAYSGVWRINRSLRSIEVTFLDAGSGDAAVIVSPGGKTLLVDVGDKFAGFNSGERIVAPYLRSIRKKHIDAIVVTHPHNNSLGGLEWILENCSVGEIWMADASYPGEYADRVLVPAEVNSVPVKKLAAGDRVIKLGGLEIEVLWPPRGYKPPGGKSSDLNAASMILKISDENLSFLFTGHGYDKIQKKVMELKKPLRSRIMSAPHHAAKKSLAPGFFDAVDPEIVVISARWSSYRPYPDKEVLKLLSQSGAKIMLTDRDGAVRVYAKGSRMKVSRWTGRRWKLVHTSQLSR